MDFTMGYAGENRKPTPTEYKGVRFRSKSEAVFARCLDLAGWDWDYEPKNASGHRWDFLVDRKTEPGSGRERFVFIEYKPSQPTIAYVRSLIEKTKLAPVESILIWGSPWSPVSSGKVFGGCSIFSSDAPRGWGVVRNKITSRDCEVSAMPLDLFADDAREYRFDLDQGAKNGGTRLDLDPDIIISSSDGAYHRERRLKKVASEAIKWIGLFKIHELHDHEGSLEVTWRNEATARTAAIIASIWGQVGSESRENVSFKTLGHSESQNACLFIKEKISRCQATAYEMCPELLPIVFKITYRPQPESIVVESVDEMGESGKRAIMAAWRQCNILSEHSPINVVFKTVK